MLTANLWTRAGLTNSLRGTVHDLVCARSPGEGVSIPDVLLLRVEHEKDPVTGAMRSPVSIPCCLPHVSKGEFTLVPVPAVERSWLDARWREHTRRMLPVVLAWAVTIHKAQGATLPLVKLRLGPTEHQLGLLFTAISRVRRLAHLALLSPIDADRLMQVSRHSALAFRKQKDADLASR